MSFFKPRTQTIAYKSRCGMCNGRGFKYNPMTGEKEKCITCEGNGKWEHTISWCEECNSWIHSTGIKERVVQGELKDLCWECASKYPKPVCLHCKKEVNPDYCMETANGYIHYDCFDEFHTEEEDHEDGSV